MRISDWSSDVCSSDLVDRLKRITEYTWKKRPEAHAKEAEHDLCASSRDRAHVGWRHGLRCRRGRPKVGRVYEHYDKCAERQCPDRSEERRVGKECVSTGIYRG